MSFTIDLVGSFLFMPSGVTDNESLAAYSNETMEKMSETYSTAKGMAVPCAGITTASVQSSSFASTGIKRRRDTKQRKRNPSIQGEGPNRKINTRELITKAVMCLPE